MSFDTSTVRDKLRDTASENSFLEAQEFTDTQISDSMDQALSYWNSEQPVLDAFQYDTVSDVPERYSDWFCRGAIGILLQNQSHVLFRNRQPARTEGIQIDINSRVEAYKQVGDQYFQQFIQWIARIKRSLASQGVLTAQPGYSVPVLHFTQYTAEDIYFDVYDRQGTKLNYSDYDSINLIIKEYPTASNTILDKEISAVSDELNLSVTDEDIEWPGIMFGETVFYKGDSAAARYPLYVNIEPSLSVDGSRQIVTVYTLREYLRDYQDENVLIEQVEFIDSLLAEAVIETVNYWNSAPPHLSRYTYTPASFPEEYISDWKRAAAGYAMINVSNRLLRNMLIDSETSVQSIQKKAELYRQLGNSEIERYQMWVQNQKRTLNLSSAWRSFGLKGF